MNQQTAQGLEIGFVAIVFALCILYLARKQRISFRYTVGWLVLSAISALTGFLIPLIQPIATRLKLDAFALVGASAIIVLPSWLRMAPLGLPVVPEVYINALTSVGKTSMG